MIEKALQIDGYMSQQELQVLAELAAQKVGEAKLIIEVGSWKGRSTRALADNLHAGKVIVVDHWLGSKGEEVTHKDAMRADGDFVYMEFLQNNEDHIGAGKIIPLRMNSKNAAEFLFKNEIFADIIFLDGGHTYEEVKEDIKNFLPLLVEGGIICGHDFSPNWQGVQKAVEEMLSHGMVFDNTTIWYFKKYDKGDTETK